jgi:hypothetical protein
MPDNHKPDVLIAARDKLLADAKEFAWVAQYTIDPQLKAHFQKLSDKALAAAYTVG